MSNFQSLKNILPKVLLEHKLNDSIVIEILKKDWDKKLEPLFKNIVVPEKFNPYSKTLYLKASSKLWAHELAEKEKVFLKKLKTAFPEIKIQHIKISN